MIFVYFHYGPLDGVGVQKRTVWGSKLIKALPGDTDLADKLFRGLGCAIEAYDNYDRYGNIVTRRDTYGNITIYLWSYHGKYPIAEIKGSTYEEVNSALRRQPEYLSEEKGSHIKGMEQLRNLLPHAQITIYDYKQSVGLKYISEPDGQASFFQYDIQGRLKQRFRKGEKGEMQLMEYNRYYYNK